MRRNTYTLRNTRTETHSNPDGPDGASPSLPVYVHPERMKEKIRRKGGGDAEDGEEKRRRRKDEEEGNGGMGRMDEEK